MGRKSRQKVLVADDDVSVLALVKETLESGGFTVAVAPGGGAAAKYIEENEQLDLLVTDVEMPDKTGIELAAEVARKRPGLPVLFITGSLWPDEASDIFINRNVLMKPFTPSALLNVVHRLLISR